MKTLEKFSKFNQGLQGHELQQVTGGGNWEYTVRNYYGTITYYHYEYNGQTLDGSDGVDSGGNKVSHYWHD
nr:hypothetical protein [uncultured Chitinophaga sp.]